MGRYIRKIFPFSMKKFVVYLTKYSGELLPPFYIGSTTEKKALSGRYFGSVRSKKWRQIFLDEIKNNPQFFSLIILSTHDTHENAIAEELNQQQKRNVVKSSEYFNESFAVPNGFFGKNVCGQNNPFYGKHHSEEFCKKQSICKKGKETWMKGKKHSEESKNKNSESHKGKLVWNSGLKNPYSEETLYKMRISQQLRREKEKLQKHMS